MIARNAREYPALLPVCTVRLPTYQLFRLWSHPINRLFAREAFAINRAVFAYVGSHCVSLCNQYRLAQYSLCRKDGRMSVFSVSFAETDDYYRVSMSIFTWTNQQWVRDEIWKVGDGLHEITVRSLRCRTVDLI